MILGILDRDGQCSGLRQDLLPLTAQISEARDSQPFRVWEDDHLAFLSVPLQIDTLDEAPQPFVNEAQTIAVVFEGKIYNLQEIKKLLGTDYKFRTECSGEALVYLYDKYQDAFLDRVNGNFAFALWDKKNHRLLLGRDRLGIEPLFYFDDGKRLIFSSSLRAISGTGWVTKQLNHEAVLQYLLYCYSPAQETFLEKIYKLPPGHILSCNGSGSSIKQYWRLSFAESQLKSEEEYREEILSLIADAIRVRLAPKDSPGVFLSGGTDSSTIVCLASKMLSEPMVTLSFRCDGVSYDESAYARLVAQRCGTAHFEIRYRPDDLWLMSRAVESMDEPFCDIGIEIATYLLGHTAKGKVSYVFSGEGGDELFGGHPVYIADKLAAVADRLPRAIVNPLARALQRIPDNDQKKNLQVKVKRFAYGLSFQPELLSHRWRIYYTPQELRGVCSKDFLAHCDMDKMYDGVLRHNREADGADPLSRSLYSDYQTLVDFYLRRLRLLRAFRVESRLPLLDHRLVECAAKIPSRLKIRGLGDTKYIYKKVLAGIVPREILYDRPKLGHSVPMKNWLRQNERIKEWMIETLSDGCFGQRNFFSPGVVQRMIEEHLRKTHNHSHRLWGLIVLELWLRDFFRSGRSVPTALWLMNGASTRIANLGHIA
jgi:asparagine synthase (glutamine-hydrolysing)